MDGKILATRANEVHLSTFLSAEQTAEEHFFLKKYLFSIYLCKHLK